MNLAGTPEIQWRKLQRGQKIWLEDATGEKHFGVVDDRTDDGAFVWVLTAGSGRKLFHVDDGFEAAKP